MKIWIALMMLLRPLRLRVKTPITNFPLNKQMQDPGDFVKEGGHFSLRELSLGI